jgi:hypothetical protein
VPRQEMTLDRVVVIGQPEELQQLGIDLIGVSVTANLTIQIGQRSACTEPLPRR